MPRFPQPAPEDPEINGLTCPDYYERKLADVDAKLAVHCADYGDAYRKTLRAGMWIKLFVAAMALFVLVMMHR